MTPPATDSLPLLETMLFRAEAPPWQPIYQTGIGFLLVPLATALRRGEGSDWSLLALFLLVLIALRVVPAVVRHLLPFSTDLQTHWSRHRVLAKHYDSYQWRKLFWYGLGLSCYMALFDRVSGIEGLLALACVLAGGLGQLAWRRVAGTKPVLAVLSSK